MNVTVEIHYISNETKVMQAGSFPSKGRNPEEVAYDWWKRVKRELPFGGELEKVLIDGEDQTHKVKELEKAPLD